MLHYRAVLKTSIVIAVFVKLNLESQQSASAFVSHAMQRHFTPVIPVLAICFVSSFSMPLMIKFWKHRLSTRALSGISRSVMVYWHNLIQKFKMCVPFGFSNWSNKKNNKSQITIMLNISSTMMMADALWLTSFKDLSYSLSFLKLILF